MAALDSAEREQREEVVLNGQRDLEAQVDLYRKQIMDLTAANAVSSPVPQQIKGLTVAVLPCPPSLSPLTTPTLLVSPHHAHPPCLLSPHPPSLSPLTTPSLHVFPEQTALYEHHELVSGVESSYGVQLASLAAARETSEQHIKAQYELALQDLVALHQKEVNAPKVAY